MQYQGDLLFENNQEIMDEVITQVCIVEENFVPDTFLNLYINIPIALLNYKDLIANNQPESSSSRRLTQADNLTLFNYRALYEQLSNLLRDEHCFFANLSAAIMKLMMNGKAVLSDCEKQIISTSAPFVPDYKAKLEESQLGYLQGRSNPNLIEEEKKEYSISCARSEHDR